MQKIGIVTICDYLNYGNRLQNYASQEVLTSLGFEVETIVNTPLREKQGGIAFTLQRIRNALRLSPAELFRRALHKADAKMSRKSLLERMAKKEKAFRAFSATHIKETDYVAHEGKMPDHVADAYDFFVVGSDQVWNPAYRKGSSFDFLQFAPPGKRIAWAPSFGVSEIPDAYAARYSKWLSEMDALSVREPAGAQIIKKLSGRDAAVLADPTLMLTKEQWLHIARPAVQKPRGKYLLTYFIGEVSPQREQYISETAERHGLEVARMASMKDKERFHAGPDEFIDYINSAELLCTDSFHGVIFSLHMQTPFVVFDREGKGLKISSRIDNLLEKTGFHSRQFHAIQDPSHLFEVDFSHIPGVLEEERARSHAYLRKALHINGEK